jgi:hypothetical protein
MDIGVMVFGKMEYGKMDIGIMVFGKMVNGLKVI